MLGVILGIPGTLLFVVMLVFLFLVVVPILKVFDMLGIYIPRGLSARYEWWEWEEMKQDEVKRLEKKELTASEEHALEQQVKKKLKEEWWKAREEWKRKWRERLGLSRRHDEVL